MFLPIVVLLSSVLGFEIYKSVTISEYLTTYEKFRQICSRPPDIRESEMYKLVTDAIQSENLSSVWLPIRRIHLGGWHWLNRQYYGKDISKPERTLPGHDCAVLRPRINMLDEVPCQTVYSYFICEEWDTYKDIPNSSNDKIIFEFSPRIYTIEEEKNKVNFYQAKEKCFLRGRQLASFPNDILNSIIWILKSRLGIYDNMWIGLRRRDYYLDFKDPEEILAQSWDESGLCTCVAKECAIFIKNRNDRFVWKPEDCHALHPFLCAVPADSSKFPWDNETPTEDPWRLYLALSLISVFLIILVLLALYLTIGRLRKKFD